MILNLESLQRAKKITYVYEGKRARCVLEPVRWDDGREVWQVTDGARNLFGFWCADGEFGPFDLGVGEFEIVEPTPEHLEILKRRAQCGRKDILVDGVRYEKDYFGREHRAELVRAS